MFDVEITNFQSIKSVSFKFEGFTTIIGRNFIGKSAVLRAINAALTNQQGTDFIRWGERFCEVRIKTKDIDILWHKEDNNNFYKINNEDVYDKIGNQPPPKPVIDAGFNILFVGKEKINLFYARQFLPLFLIDRLDAKSADLLISIYGLDKLYKAIDLCAKDQRENSNILKLRKNDLEQSEKDLDKFIGFDEIKAALKTLDANKIALNQKNDLINKLKIWMERVDTYTKELKKFKPIKNIEIPTCISIDKALKEFEKVKTFFQNIVTLKKDFLRIREVKNINISEELSININKNIEKIKEIKSFQTKYDALNKQINNLKNIKIINVPEMSGDKIEAIKNLKEIFQKTVNIVTEIKKIKISAKESIEELEKVNKELSVYDHCPACGSKL
jgi:DNA repair ATPase RecN